MPKNSGFTLIELMVVVSIIAILSLVGMTVYTGVQKSARDAKRKGDIDAIAIALDIHKTASGYQVLQAGWFSSGSIPRDPIYNSCSAGGPSFNNGGCTETIGSLAWGYVVCGATSPFAGGSCNTFPAENFYICTRMENNSGGNHGDMWFTTPTTNGSTYCRRNQQ